MELQLEDVRESAGDASCAGIEVSVSASVVFLGDSVCVALLHTGNDHLQFWAML